MSFPRHLRRSLQLLILFLAIAGVYASHALARQIVQAVDNGLPVVEVDTVEIEGEGLSDFEKKAMMESLRGESTHPDWMDRLKAKAIRILHNDGFLDGETTVKVLSMRAAEGKEHVTIALTIASGKRYFIKQIWWMGSSVFTPTQLDNLTLMRVGNTFTPAALIESDLVLHQAYVERGYDEMTLLSQFQKVPETGYVILYLEVMEGKQSLQKQAVSCAQYSASEMSGIQSIPGTDVSQNADAELRIAQGKITAQQKKKNLLIIAGGAWCGWCRVLDQTFVRNPGLQTLLDAKFTVVHVDVSKDVNRLCALRDYPVAPSFPFLYVLDETGKLLGTEDTKQWQSSDGYDPTRIAVFLEKW